LLALGGYQQLVLLLAALGLAGAVAFAAARPQVDAERPR
jgi:hypothetical protein